MKKPKALGIKRRITVLDRMDAVKRLQSVGEERKAQLLHRSTKDEIDRLPRAAPHHADECTSGHRAPSALKPQAKQHK